MMFYYIYRLPLMKTKKASPLPRRDIIEIRSLIQPDLTIVKANDKYRNSMAADYRPTQRETLQGWSRYSVSIGSNEKAPRVETMSPISTQTMKSIRQTLNQLQVRIESAKEELRGNLILGKSVIEEQEQDDSRTLDLISFNDSEHSHQTEEINRIGAKKEWQKREAPLIDLSKVKTYYMSELAKIFTTGNQRARDHLVHSWKIINAYRNLFDPNPQANPKQIVKTNVSKTIDRKTLVLGLDGALIHCSNEWKSEQDIEFYLTNSKGDNFASFLRIRPHAISFLKKMNKKYDIVIFSNRNQLETDLILQELDPLCELFALRLYNDSCSQVGNLQIKDLRVLKRDLSSVVLVDSTPSSYIQQLTNGIPLLPFTGGPDCELYSLEKYLEQLSKASDIRERNGKYFQLSKYGDWKEPMQGVKELYFSRE